jgi:hypothetical protein
MTVIQQGIQVIENPVGKGFVFKGEHFIAEVSYELQVFRGVRPDLPIKSVVKGKIKRIDRANILWGTELLTLRLQDNRKLDFICVNFDPECNIASDSGFYT